MRWAGLAIILLTLPLFVAILSSNTARRDGAVMAIGAMLFCVGEISPSAAFYVWPEWQGLSKGMFLSLVDSLALALLFTRPSGRYRISFLPLIALFFITIILSLFSASIKIAGVFIVFQTLQMIVLFIALASELHRPQALRALMKGLAIGLVIQALFVIRQKVAGMIQAPGTFDHQNVLGLAVELSVLPLIAAVLEGERSKIVYLGIIAGAICIAGGGSRGSLGFFALGAILLILASLIRRGTARKWQMLVLGGLAAGIMAPFAIGTLSERFGGGEFTTEETARIALADAARGMSADHPLGVGANNFVPVSNLGGYLDKVGTTLTFATRSQPVHNAYLVARAERGWAGEIALILLLGGIATAAFLTAFRNTRATHSGVALGSGAALVAVGLHSNFEYAVLTSSILSLVFVNAALVSSSRAREVQSRVRAARVPLNRHPVPPVEEGV